jgi:hypothetical protein
VREKLIVELLKYRQWQRRASSQAMGGLYATYPAPALDQCSHRRRKGRRHRHQISQMEANAEDDPLGFRLF